MGINAISISVEAFQGVLLGLSIEPMPGIGGITGFALLVPLTRKYYA